MGWTYLEKQPEQSVREVMEQEFNWEDGTKKQRVLACAVTSPREAYLAIEQVKNGKREVFAVVCLLDYPRDSYFNFGYKAISEEMGPYYYNCPAKILNLLTPTANQTALEWRRRCQEFAEKKAKTSAVLRPGAVIVFEEPIHFTDGSVVKAFTIQSVKAKYVIARGENKWLYRLPKRLFVSRAFTIPAI